MDGVVVVDKPAGMTSHDVVDEVRRRLGTRRVGHAGTLDPNATGVLVVGIGRATRFLSYAQRLPKRYRAVARFGVATSTQDAWGEIVERVDRAADQGEVERVLDEFTGEIEQIPPMVSAVKVGGERLYKKARRGEEVERAPRKAVVHELSLISFDSGGPGLPEATLDVRCSSGTYVRTLIHDIGRRLGCGAHMAALRRTETGGFTEADAIPPADVGKPSVRPLLDAVRGLPVVEVGDEIPARVVHGRSLRAADDTISEGELVAITSVGRLLAVYVRHGDELLPERVVAP